MAKAKRTEVVRSDEQHRRTLEATGTIVTISSDGTGVVRLDAPSLPLGAENCEPLKSVGFTIPLACLRQVWLGALTKEMLGARVTMLAYLEIA